MDFKTAAAFVMPFGKHKGKALDRIGETDDGLLYLDWLLGQREKESAHRHAADADLNDALRHYLGDETIAAELAKLLDR